jgi:alkylation response protein AidB-like acyl-CoA dehydrogenase
MSAAFLHPAVAADIFRSPRAILAWGPGADARAVAEDGGFRVTGTWSFASGGRHATWFGGHCAVREADGTPRRGPDGTPEWRTMLFPAARAEMRDVWHVLGLRGTGSDAYSVDGLHVPAAYSLARDSAAERREPGPLYLFPAGSLFASGFAAVALALGRRLLDAFVELAREKTPRGARHTVRENAVVQSQVARAEARLRAARGFLLGSLGEVWRAVLRDHALTVEQRMLIRLAGTHAIHEAKAVADLAYHAAGATAIFASAPFERPWRDLHAVLQQLQGRQAHYETVGQFLLGLDADLTWL